MKTKPIPWIALLAALLFPHTPSFAQVPEDPYQAAGIAAPGSQDGPASILLRYEVFSAEPPLAALMRREKTEDKAFYESLVGKLGGGEVRQEGLTMVRMPSGMKSRVQSVREIIYPSEYSPARVAAASGKQKEDIPSGAASPEVVIPVLPTSFETRDTGDTIEMEVVVDMKGSVVELRFVQERALHAGRVTWGQGTSEVQFPIFETQRLDGFGSFPPGVPFFLGTLTPPAGSKVTSSRVWFAFVTATTNSK